MFKAPHFHIHSGLAFSVILLLLTPNFTAPAVPSADEPSLPDLSNRFASFGLLYERAIHFLEHQRRGDLDQAVRLLLEITRVDPDFAPALSGLAETQALRFLWGWDPSPEHLRKAVKEAERSVGLNPEQAATRIGLGLVYFASDRYSAALGELNQAVSLEPDSFRAHLYRGILLRNLRRLAEARREIARALELRPSSPTAYSLLGDYHQDRREFEAARQAYWLAAKLDHELLWPRLGLAAVHERDGSFVSARKSYFVTERDFPEDRLRCRILSASLLVVSGDYEGAIKIYEKSLKEEKVSPPLMRRLMQAGRAYSLEQTGKEEKAEYYWSQLVEEFPADFDGSYRDREVVSLAYEALARFYDGKDESERSRQLLEEACRRPGMKFRLYGDLADRLSKTGEPERAVVVLLAGLEGAPENVDLIVVSEAVLRTARAGRAGGRESAPPETERLLRNLEERLADSPNPSYVPSLNLARCWALATQPERALPHLRTAVEKGYDASRQAPEDPDLEALSGHPEFRQLLGRHDSR